MLDLTNKNTQKMKMSIRKIFLMLLLLIEGASLMINYFFTSGYLFSLHVFTNSIFFIASIFLLIYINGKIQKLK